MRMPGVSPGEPSTPGRRGIVLHPPPCTNGIQAGCMKPSETAPALTPKTDVVRERNRAHVVRQNPPIGRVRWSLRNNNNYEQTASSSRSTTLPTTASISCGCTTKPTIHSEPENRGTGAVCAAGQRSAARRQAELLRVLAEAGGGDFARHLAFTVTVPAGRKQRARRARRRTRRRTRRAGGRRNASRSPRPRRLR